MAPKVLEERRSFADYGTLSIREADTASRSGLLMGAPTGPSHDVPVSEKGTGRFEDLNQNRTTIRNVRDRYDGSSQA